MPAHSSLRIQTISDFELSGKLLFLRVDFNVPLSKPNSEGICQVEDDSRIQEALPTIRYAVEKGAKVVLASHLGRPNGRRKLEFSMEPVAHRLAELLGQEVTLAEDCIGDGIELMVKSLKPGQILLLENLRFYPGEEANDTEFAGRLARLGEIFINDAFGTAHRKHASTYGVPSILSQRGIGFLMDKELQYLDPLLHHPKKPYYAVLGGSKVSEKIQTIESLLREVDGLVIGGAMAHAFWAAQGDEIPPKAKQPKPEDVDAARAIFKAARRREIPVYIPSDTQEGFDLGPKTIEQFSTVLSQARTVFWNGPLGWFENPQYSQGTFAIAEVLAQNTEATKIVGGGDTVSAIKQSGHASGFHHLSTGGGAVLEYLEGKGLPGIDILKLSNREIAHLQQKMAE
ncbi:MAG: phosphoglycerate kinase [Bdellovibrionia bacterium]